MKGAVLAIVPVLNGLRLTELIEDVEQHHFYEPSGGYAGLVPSHFDFGPLDDYFMGASSIPTFKRGSLLAWLPMWRSGVLAA